MTRSTQPPEETFCMNCGPDAVLPAFPLFVVTGANGTGPIPSTP